MVEKARDSAAIRAPPNGPRAMTDLSRIEDHHGEDQVRTFCTEGTPMNFLSTATSMNEINKVCSDSVSRSFVCVQRFTELGPLFTQCVVW